MLRGTPVLYSTTLPGFVNMALFATRGGDIAGCTTTLDEFDTPSNSAAKLLSVERSRSSCPLPQAQQTTAAVSWTLWAVWTKTSPEITGMGSWHVLRDVNCKP